MSLAHAPGRIRSNYEPGYNPSYPSLGTGDAGSRPWVDDHGMISVGPRGMKDLLIEAMSLGVTTKPYELETKFRVENLDFPDCFGLPDFPEVWMTRADAKTGWVSKCMPERRVNRLEIGGDLLIFNDTNPERLPEESVPNFMTQSRQSWKDSIVRWGKGIRMERGAFHTPFGRTLYYYQLEQLNNAVVIAQNHSRLCALYYTERPEIKKRSDRMNDAFKNLGKGYSAQQVLKHTFDNWGVLNKHPHKLLERMFKYKREFRLQSQGSEPNRVIFPEGSSVTWKFANLGTYAETGYKLGTMPNWLQISADGMQYCESFNTRIDDGKVDHDPAFGLRSIGGYFTLSAENWNVSTNMPWTADCMTNMVFDESSDSIVPLRFKSIAKFLGLWDHYDQCDSEGFDYEPSTLTDYGMDYMGSATSWMDLYKRSAHSREIQKVCESILKKSDFLRQIMERASQQDRLVEEGVHGAQPLSDVARKTIADLSDALDQHARGPNGVYKKSEKPSSALFARAQDSEFPAQVRVSGRRDDWFAQFGNNVQITDKVRTLYEQINRDSVNSRDILNDWASRFQQNGGRDFYRTGLRTFTHVQLNNELTQAVQSDLNPISGIEKVLKNNARDVIDQPFLNSIDEQLETAQSKEVQYLGSDKLTLITNDGPRSFNYPALLFPLSNLYVVLMQINDLTGLSGENWITKVFNVPSDSNSRSFAKNASRMALVFHSIEVSLIYAAAKSKGPVRAEALVQSQAPYPMVADEWDEAIRSVRDSQLETMDCQSEFSRQIQLVREFIKRPSVGAFDKLRQSIKNAQSGTSGQRNVPTTYKEEPLLEAVKAKLVAQSVNIPKFQEDFHPGSAVPNQMVIKNLAELLDPVKRAYWDTINILSTTIVDRTQMNDFRLQLARNVIVLSALNPGVRFENTPLEHASINDIVMPYIYAVATYMATHSPADTIAHMNTDLKMFTSLTKGEGIRALFSPIFNSVLVTVNESSPSVSSNFLNRFETFRLTGVAKKVDPLNQDATDAKNYIKDRIHFITEDADFRINMNEVTQQATKLLMFFFEARRSGYGGNVYNIMYERTNISNVFPDIRQLYSQSIAVLVYAVANMLKENNQNDSNSKTLSDSMEALLTSSYVNGQIGRWGAIPDKILLSARFYASGQEGKVDTLNTDVTNTIIDGKSLGKLPATVIVNSKRSTSDITIKDVADILSLLPVRDAWYFKKCFEEDIVPPIGYIYEKPHATYEMGTLILCIDGSVGSLDYMPPEIAAGEDPRDMMMHFTFAMYYKGIVHSGRDLLRIPDVYCRRYVGGNGLQTWDPTNPSHVSLYTTNTQQNEIAKDGFVKACDMWHDHSTTTVRDITGEFPAKFPATREDKERTQYPGSKTLCQKWRWTNANVMKEDNYYNQSQYVPRWNTILCQDHQGMWDGKGGFSRIIENRGAWGNNIYNGCSSDRSGGTLESKSNQVMIQV